MQNTESSIGPCVAHTIQVELSRTEVQFRAIVPTIDTLSEGKRLGQRPLDEKTVKEIRRLRHQEKKSLRQIAKRLGVARQTVANY